MAISGFPQNTSNAANVGDLSQLPTSDKTDIVSAIIELNTELNAIPNVYQQQIQLTATDISNKFIELDFIPNSEVELFVVQGINQKQNVDFVVSGQTLSWANLALESLVSTGSFLHLSYIRG